MPDRITWITHPPTAEIDGDGVLVVAKSSEAVILSRISRANFRAFVEHGRRALEEADRLAVVVPFERSG